MDSPPVCVVDALHACRCCAARGPDECPYRYLLADLATLDRWSSSAEGPADDAPEKPDRTV